MRQESKVSVGFQSRANASKAQSHWTKGTERFSKLILIVDNQSYTSRIMSHTLNRWGYSTEIAHSTEAALNLLANDEVIPEMILVEISQLSDSLFDFPDRVHAMPLCADIPIVAHSVRRESQLILKAIRSGYCDFILRPTDPTILQEKIVGLFAKTAKAGSLYALPIVDHGSASIDLRLTAINEVGIEGYSSVPLTPNSVMRLNSDLIGKLHLELENFRVVHCEETELSGPLKYKVAFSFVGLGPAGARAIRQHLIRAAAQSKYSYAA